ncbi:MAG: LPXTG cell wall anchor domain-containing protein, partial [Eubacterium sp.]|nr:LPXTG cell wall anchor domain-containing protein [Eubacterium sp.]
NNNKAVNTGDSVDIGLLYMIMLCSAVCIALLLRKKKR